MANTNEEREDISVNAQELFNRFKDEAQYAWHSLADQFHHFEQRNNHALTPFRAEIEESDDNAEHAQLNGKTPHPQWGLIPVDMLEIEDNLVVNVEIPGLDSSSINIAIEGNELIVSGSKQKPQNYQTSIRQIGREIAYGQFERRITLTGNRLKKTDNDASYNNGVLTITLPYDGLTETQQRRTIELQ